MSFPMPDSGMTKGFRKTTVFLLLAYVALGVGPAGSSVLCVGEDGHLALESAATCAFCALRPIRPVQSEYLVPGGEPGPGCGPCRDFSIHSTPAFPGFSVPPPPGAGMSVASLRSMESAGGALAVVESAFSGSGPLRMPDPLPLPARPVVLLI
jgi:hypothetical protein